MKKLRTVFFGTPELATLVLDELERAGIVPSLIVTAPDKPQGRKMIMTASPVKVWANTHGIEVLQPNSLTHGSDPAVRALSNSEWDLFIVAAYGLLIPTSLLDLPVHGALNVHPSLLPKFRGASPIRSAILADEKTTGVTIMKLDEKLDHGPIVAQARIELDEGWPPYGRALDAILAHEGGKLLAEVIPKWVEGSITPEPQNDAEATYCGKITKDMGELNLNDDAYKNLLKIRAFDGWPGTYFFVERGSKRVRVKITEAELGSDNCLLITKVIPEGKKEMPYEVFLKSA